MAKKAASGTSVKKAGRAGGSDLPQSSKSASDSAGKSAGKPEKDKTAALAERIVKASRTVRIPRAKLREAVYNPRSITPAAFRKLCASIKRYGMVDPPVVNQRTGYTIVGGHQRLKALDKVIGSTDYELEVRLVDVDLPTEKALNIVLNNPSAQGEFDITALQDLIGELKAAEVDVEDTGFTETDLHNLFGDMFLSGPFAEQAEAERESVELLAEMRAVGEEERKAAAAGSQSARREEGSAAGVGTDGEAIGDATPDGNHSLPPGPGAAGSASAAASGATSADSSPPPFTNEMLRDRRAAYKAEQAERDQADTIVTIVFRNQAELLAFLKQFELDTVERYFPISEFAERLGVALEHGT